MDRDTTLDITAQTLAVSADPQPVSTLFARHVKSGDLPKFYALQQRNQDRIKKLFHLFELIEQQPTRDLGYQVAATAAGDERGYSAKNLRRIYTTFKKCPDWRELIDGALEWKPNQPLPQEFIDHLNEEADKNPRSITQVLKSIRRNWTLGKHIPGYGTWKDWFMLNHPGRPLPKIAPGHPTGWSQDNLRRYLDSSKFRRKAATIGRGAAALHRPLVLTSRVGCWVASHYMWDDVWHDLFINSVAQKQAGRPLELFCHDYFSARKVRWGFKVRTEDDNGKSQGLTGKMMRMIVAATYYLDGYSPRGTINVAEHGTAAFTEAMERTLYDASEGLITVSRSGMGGNPAHLGQYNGRRIGNPRFKASLESSNNLLHNMEAFLPGQTGPSRERRPEQLHGMLAYNERLLCAMQQLSPEHAALLQFDFLEEVQYAKVLAEIYHWMETDDDHRLADWLECGHVTSELHLLGHWMSQAEVFALEDSQKQTALALLQSGTVKTRPRLLTRREVWDAGSTDLIRISGGTVCELLGDDFAKERKVRSHQFHFEDQEVHPGEHRFEGIITDPEGRQQALKDGETYKVFINPFAPDQLFVTNAKGRFLGVSQRTHKASRADLEAIQRAMGRVAEIETTHLEPLRLRQAKAARTKLKLHQHNAAVLQDAAAQQQKAVQTTAAALALAAKRKQFTDNATTTLNATQPHGYND